MSNHTEDPLRSLRREFAAAMPNLAVELERAFDGKKRLDLRFVLHQALGTLGTFDYSELDHHARLCRAALLDESWEAVEPHLRDLVSGLRIAAAEA